MSSYHRYIRVWVYWKIVEAMASEDKLDYEVFMKDFRLGLVSIFTYSA